MKLEREKDRCFGCDALLTNPEDWSDDCPMCAKCTEEWN